MIEVNFSDSRDYALNIHRSLLHPLRGKIPGRQISDAGHLS